MAEETIAAIATPPGRGGIGIIRLSGPLSYQIGLSITHQQKILCRKAVFTAFYDRNEELIDEGIILYFKGPSSFTGEDVVEFQTHGSPVVLHLLLQVCVAYGARIARPGEFSERAFLNDKLDLTQAEAIADLIDASSVTAARMAVRSLQGDFSKKINVLNEKLIHLRLYVEAAIDFPEEEVDFLGDGKILKLLTGLIDELEGIRHGAAQGALLREGLTVVIAGEPNAGKSTLINQLARREVAIVTDVAGTTRDVMREAILVDDLPLHIVDTAGLRVSQDIVEQEGIKRAWQEIKQADCVIQLIDINTDYDGCVISDQLKKALPQNVPLLQVFNKIDRYNKELDKKKDALYISAKSGIGLSALKNKLKEAVGYQPAEGQYMARSRHLLCLDKVLELLKKGQNCLISIKAGELVAEDLKQAHQFLGEITGEFSSDDLLGKIFASFCIGK